PAAAEPVDQLDGEVDVHRAAQLDGAAVLLQPPLEPARDDDAERPGNVHVVRREHDRRLRPGSLEAAPELLQPGARHRRHAQLLGRAQLGDGDSPVRGDGGDDDARHRRQYRPSRCETETVRRALSDGFGLDDEPVARLADVDVRARAPWPAGWGWSPPTTVERGPHAHRRLAARHARRAWPRPAARPRGAGRAADGAAT